MSTPPGIPAFRPVPFTGVIFVMAEAGQRGYRYGHPDWCNLGQGQPETGPLPGAPPRMHRIEIGVDDQDYAPVPGIWELRRAVAELYNGLYRQGKRSQYTERNVCICGGGRASLTRAVAALGQVNLGHFLPDYTAYEELLDIFRRFTPIPILLDSERGYDFSLNELRREVSGRGLGALLLSNPCNPTGKAITGACNTAFLVLAVSGIYLWWPRRWSVESLKAIVLFRGGLAGKARDWNWHNVIGIWSAPVLIVLTASGMVISYRWASDLVYRAAGSTPACCSPLLSPPAAPRSTSSRRSKSSMPPAGGMTRGSSTARTRSSRASPSN